MCGGASGVRALIVFLMMIACIATVAAIALGAAEDGENLLSGAVDPGGASVAGFEFWGVPREGLPISTGVPSDAVGTPSAPAGGLVWFAGKTYGGPNVF